MWLRSLVLGASLSISRFQSLIQPKGSVAFILGAAFFVSGTLSGCAGPVSARNSDWAERYYCDPDNTRARLYESTVIYMGEKMSCREFMRRMSIEKRKKAEKVKRGVTGAGDAAW